MTEENVSIETSSDAAPAQVAAKQASAATQACEAKPCCSGPPPAPRHEAAPPDPRGDMLRLAEALKRTRNAWLLADYLRLRRAAIA